MEQTLKTKIANLITKELGVCNKQLPDKILELLQEPRFDKAKIVIDEDGWVYMRDRQGRETGLGDLGVDVEIEDNFNKPKVWK